MLRLNFNALNGLFPFLPDFEKGLKVWTVSQRPKQASFISTCNGADLLLFKQGLRDNSFFINALNGPFHSTCNGADLLLLKQGVSMP